MSLSSCNLAIILASLMTIGLVGADLNVTVHFDATYAIDSSRGPICSGEGAEPNGIVCPLKDDVATADCHPSYSTYNGTDCIAPADAKCVVGSDSLWRCVFSDGDNNGLDADVEDLTSTLTIASDQTLEDSPWGDLPWRAPPPADPVSTTAEEHVAIAVA
ncbi:hypothetical protein PHYBOEH_008601 [Phytophthora boehmeriae]|uniref:Uncharacterized protein n=1 Tax=Phytophthora boehmeriae TaxID=109152 RepID=A0A8T1W2G0_9STRA|nr:hypothetical protein PHYBOEH_008601 [Phytophthora boehmeriae]